MISLLHTLASIFVYVDRPLLSSCSRSGTLSRYLLTCFLFFCMPVDVYPLPVLSSPPRWWCCWSMTLCLFSKPRGTSWKPAGTSCGSPPTSGATTSPSSTSCSLCWATATAARTSSSSTWRRPTFLLSTTTFRPGPPANYSRNPWFQAYYDAKFGCSSAAGVGQSCDMTRGLSRRDDYVQDPYVLYVVNAVVSAGLGIPWALSSICGSAHDGVCPKFEVTGDRRDILLSEMKVRFKDYTRQPFYYEETRESSRGYHIYNVTSALSSAQGGNYMFQNVSACVCVCVCFVCVCFVCVLYVCVCVCFVCLCVCVCLCEATTSITSPPLSPLPRVVTTCFKMLVPVLFLCVFYIYSDSVDL